MRLYNLNSKALKRYKPKGLLVRAGFIFSNNYFKKYHHGKP